MLISFCSRGNQGWPDSSRDQRIWLNAPPGLSRQESGHKEEQQLFYRRDQIDSVNREVHSRHQRSEHRFESRYDSMRRSEPNPFNFQVQDQNLRPDDLRCRLWDQGEAAGQWSSEIKVAYESRVIVSRTETFSSGSSFRDHSQGQTLEVSSKRSRQEQELGPEETPMQRKLYNSETRLDQLAIAENKKKVSQKTNTTTCLKSLSNMACFKCRKIDVLSRKQLRPFFTPNVIARRYFHTRRYID